MEKEYRKKEKYRLTCFHIEKKSTFQLYCTVFSTVLYCNQIL